MLFFRNPEGGATLKDFSVIGDRRIAKDVNDQKPK
jgi:hypothetical protein